MKEHQFPLTPKKFRKCKSGTGNEVISADQNNNTNILYKAQKCKTIYGDSTFTQVALKKILKIHGTNFYCCQESDLSRPLV